MTTADLAALGLRVKPLQWRSWPFEGRTDWEASGVNGNYLLHLSTGLSVPYFTVSSPYSCEIGGEFYEREAAIAAANAHHAAQIAALIERNE